MHRQDHRPRLPSARPELPQGRQNGGYQGEIAASAARQERVDLAIIKRSDRVAGFVVLPRRWVVERSFAWFGRKRRLAKDVETLTASSTAMLYLAATRLRPPWLKNVPLSVNSPRIATRGKSA